jgi:hypothetical protein
MSYLLLDFPLFCIQMHTTTLFALLYDRYKSLWKKSREKGPKRAHTDDIEELEFRAQITDLAITHSNIVQMEKLKMD